MPSWDNTSRRKKGAYIFAHSCPELYEQWLAECIRWTRRHHTGEEQMVFINAWNEWGEGCHLEPDHRYGHRFLEATRNAHRHFENLPASYAGLASAGDDHVTSKQASDEVGSQTSQLLLENLYLKLRLRDQYLQTHGSTVPLESALVPKLPKLDSFLAHYLLADNPRFRRTRKVFYQLLKPIWRTWLAVRSPTLPQTLRIRRHLYDPPQ